MTKRADGEMTAYERAVVMQKAFGGKKLTPSQRARLAGLARAHKAGKEGMAAAGRKGGTATLERHGRGHFLRISLKAHGYEVDA